MREGKEGRKELLDPAAGKVASLKTLQGGVSGGGSEEGREGDSFFPAGISSVTLHKPSFLLLEDLVIRSAGSAWLGRSGRVDDDSQPRN